MSSSTNTESLDWFERITGFREGPYAWTQAQLRLEEGQLVSLRDGARHHTGRFEMVSLDELRRTHTPPAQAAPNVVRTIVGDARAMHADAANAGATFQVASQFNALEMVGPNITPEHGVTRYASDRTQGPACAIAAGAGTIWRNYFAPVSQQQGQTADRQLDGLSAMGEVLADALDIPRLRLWEMRNGYALCTSEGLEAIGRLLQRSNAAQHDRLRGLLRVGWHRGADVTDLPPSSRHKVDQIYCSALPVAYGRSPAQLWEPFARLVLQGAYEATLLAASQHAAEGGSNRVLLTGLGGGAFGNASEWIADAIVYALDRVPNAGLEIFLVGYREVPAHFRRFEQ